MNKYLYTAIVFMAGVIIGWVNPIEGPLDWTYDEYASQPAHKYPSKVAPLQKEKKVIELDEDEVIVPVVQTLFSEQDNIGDK